jgi:hypothetical protein
LVVLLLGFLGVDSTGSNGVSWDDQNGDEKTPPALTGLAGFLVLLCVWCYLVRAGLLRLMFVIIWATVAGVAFPGSVFIGWAFLVVLVG